MRSRFGGILCGALALTMAAGFTHADEESKQDAKKKREVAEESESVWEYLSKLYDKDSDGKISRAEYTRDDEHWKRLDKDGDGFIVQAEVDSGGRRGGRRGGMRGGMRGERAAAPKPPKVGEVAPLFELDVLDEKKDKKAGSDDKKKDAKTKAKKPKKVKLADFQGKKPVALIFGSYT